MRLEREDGKKIDLKRLVKHQKYGSVNEYKVWVWDAKHQKRFPLRLVISLLPRKQAMAARVRKQERLRRKKGAKANLASAWWAGVMLIGTTLPQESRSAQDVVKLYRVRWQIELFFKRLKSGLQMHLLPVKLWERASTYVHLCLIVWSLQEQEVIGGWHAVNWRPSKPCYVVLGPTNGCVTVCPFCNGICSAETAKSGLPRKPKCNTGSFYSLGYRKRRLLLLQVRAYGGNPFLLDSCRRPLLIDVPSWVESISRNGLAYLSMRPKT